MANVAEGAPPFLLGGENERVCFAEGELGIQGDHVHKSEPESSIGRGDRNANQPPHGRVTWNPLGKNPVLPVQLVAVAVERESRGKLMLESEGDDSGALVRRPREVFKGQAIRRPSITLNVPLISVARARVRRSCICGMAMRVMILMSNITVIASMMVEPRRFFLPTRGAPACGEPLN